MEILIFITVALAGAGIWFYNRLIKARNIVEQAWADIDVQLQKRHGLVPNLVATVKGYMQHEASVLEGVTLSRAGQAIELPALAEQETALSRALGRLFALAEDYPELKASDGFAQLHGSLVEIEDHIQYARRYYNGAVRDNNNLVESFPANLVANGFRFSSAEFFEIELASQREAPDVRL